MERKLLPAASNFGTRNGTAEWKREMDVAMREYEPNELAYFGILTIRRDYDVCDVFSPPRTVRRAQMHGLRGVGRWIWNMQTRSRADAMT